MRILPSLTSLVIAVLLLTHPAAHGQGAVFGDEGIFCNSGLQPDGFIDFSGLPPAPVVVGPGPPSEGVTPPISAILPVKGVPGLTVQISIPALQIPIGSAGFSADGAELKFNGLPNVNAIPQNLITLTFSQPISGAALNIGILNGRFSYSYSLLVGNGSPSGVPPFSSTAAGYTLDSISPRSENLQVVGLTTTFSIVTVQYIGDPGEGLQSPILSNIRIQSSTAPNPADSIPKQGLEMWLRNIDNPGASIFSGDSTWNDQSGNGHNATATPGHAPTLIADGRTCRSAWRFNASSSFDFNLPISGWSEMTVFLVARSTKDPPPDSYDSSSAGIFWTENADWGNTFVSPYQSHLFARFGSTRPNTNLEYIRPGAGIGGDFTITRAVHDRETDSLFVNGTKVLSQHGNHPVLGGVTGDGTIGRGTNGTYYDGEISEILVYKRVLSMQEAAQVESYLRKRFGID